MTMSQSEISVRSRFWASRRGLLAGAAVVVLAAGGATALAASHPGSHQRAASATRLTSASCGGPTGAAYIALAGWDGFSAINTANCDILQTYNVGDPQVPGDPGDYNYASTDEGVAVSGSTLYFADAGSDNISVIDSATLDPSNYNPTETDIHVGFVPTDLTVNPSGSQLWVADTGPQTDLRKTLSGIKVISTASNTVVGKLRLYGGPEAIAFSPSGRYAYVTSSIGLYVIKTSNLHVAGFIRGLGDPHGVVVSPDGSHIYVTDTQRGEVDVIDAARLRVTGRIAVGQLPWQIITSSDGSTIYVTDADSNAVSVISAATQTVTHTISLAGDPDTLALTPDGSELWVAGLTSAWVTIYDTSNYSEAGTINLGGFYANSADGYEPTGIVLVSTPTPGSSSRVKFKQNGPGATKS
jgi:YVTN family beta-propeller protein